MVDFSVLHVYVESEESEYFVLTRSSSFILSMASVLLSEAGSRTSIPAVVTSK